MPFLDVVQGELDSTTVLDTGMCVRVLRDDVIMDGEDIFYGGVPDRASLSILRFSFIGVIIATVQFSGMKRNAVA